MGPLAASASVAASAAAAGRRTAAPACRNPWQDEGRWFKSTCFPNTGSSSSSGGGGGGGGSSIGSSSNSRCPRAAQSQLSPSCAAATARTFPPRVGPLSAAASVRTDATNDAPSAEVLAIWQTADAVCFDVDSTVCTDEGIDELAAFCGAGEAVAAWTTKAMTGNVLFEDALKARLDIIKPSAADLASYLAQNPPKLSPGIKELVAAIKSRGAEVYLISGGFRQMIEPVAALLGIPKDQIIANRLLFDDATGNFAGFDPQEPTSRSGGKATATKTLKEAQGFKTLVMVGDGVTDLEARQPGGADAFVGYGGVHVRPKVAAGADWFVKDFSPLIDALQ